MTAPRLAWSLCAESLVLVVTGPFPWSSRNISDIGTDLLAVVTKTAQPAHISLWLRTTETPR